MVCVGAPGPLDPWSGIIYSPPNLPGWDAMPLKSLLEEALGLPVMVANDANLAALGEHRFGAGRGCRHLVYMTISTGIGGGIIADGQLLLGAKGLAGEIGHTTVSSRGTLCGCGNRGCLEAVAAGPAIAAAGARAARSGRSAMLSAMAGGAPTAVTSEMVVRAAGQSDPEARRILRRAGSLIGLGLANIAHITDPQAIIVGGGVAMGAGALLLEPARVEFRRRVMPPYRDIPIVPAVLGDDAGLAGAAALAFDALNDSSNTGAALPRCQTPLPRTEARP
jgi:glucokinase